jgi:tetratricopeptide (TPR) repeat protein
VSTQLHQILGARAAVEFLIVRAETEPAWLARRTEDFWAQHHWRLSVWRTEAGELGSLEPRLLALVLAELTRTLENREYRSMEIYHKRYSYFWEAKAGDFFATASECIDRHRDSEESLKFAAEYLYAGLERYDAAIDTLTVAYKKGILGREGRAQLVAYLQLRGKYAESLVVLEGSDGLVEKWQDCVEYRVFLILGFHGTGQKDKTVAAREAADTYFRADKRWNEHAAVQLADACLRAELFTHAVDYFKEAIVFRKKANPVGRGGDGQLSGYYERQGDAYVRLGRTADAVDAAAGAIVVWGKDIDQRKRVIEHMKVILTNARDLVDYALTFDRECEQTKLEKPVIRKALGRVFMERKDFAAAALHLEACLQSGPFETEVLRLLVQAYDAQGAAAKGTARLLALARGSGHNFELYKELGERLRREGDGDNAERALTTLAEMSANESEGRALLAQVRENDKRFLEAAAEWRHVVRVRSKEPTGYLGLGKCLLQAGQRDEARKILEEFLGEDWPARFGDVKAQARALLGDR